MFVAAVLGGATAVGIGAALAWKWSLGVLRAAVSLTLVATFVGIAAGLVGSWLSAPAILVAAVVASLTLGLNGAFVLYRFFRNPDRFPPAGEGLIVSPADGKVIYVRKVRDGFLPVLTKNGKAYSLRDLTKTPLELTDAVVIGIALTFLDVHVTRAPVSGIVARYDYFPGAFGSLRRQEMLFENERATIVIERANFQVAVVLIASRLVRRIVSYVEPGRELSLGERIAFIRFGSQVDLVLPAEPDVHILVDCGDQVIAGETVVARKDAAEQEV